MFPYTAEEAEWLSMQGDSPYWLLSPADIEPVVPAADDLPPSGKAAVAA